MDLSQLEVSDGGREGASRPAEKLFVPVCGQPDHSPTRARAGRAAVWTGLPRGSSPTRPQPAAIRRAAAQTAGRTRQEALVELRELQTASWHRGQRIHRALSVARAAEFRRLHPMIGSRCSGRSGSHIPGDLLRHHRRDGRSLRSAGTRCARSSCTWRADLRGSHRLTRSLRRRVSIRQLGPRCSIAHIVSSPTARR